MSVKVGDLAPDFELDGIDGRTGGAGRWRLSELRGKPVVVAFYPQDDSPVCTKQLQAYTEGISSLEALDTQVLAISPQSVESHRAFAADNDGFAFPVLSDVDKEVARSYGILGLLDLYRRSTFVIDSAGVVQYVHRAVGPGLSFVPIDDLVAAIDAT
ncbi:MAG TPA: peroxiredoxin [Microthrixaceae bacterium]|nr:peroxiredoxin [Microthrixaceae bacterium]